ncbi:SDR family oxidoreductase [Dyella jiangningensis]|uniref:Short-chain dehydrogenase n=1 Tax=Dyella jiangningensis TaxID=1379159 RepID=A0A328P0G8_9GAMM|nr:SDR family oxidoreductase [Dyella jiangningensis]RAO74536.1 short-chain dehydrogenase [Dyella jiangningensis]
MNIQGSIALVTGANRGLGLAYAKALLAAGARKVYAGARDPSTVTLPGVIPVKLDVTSPQDVAAAAALCGDVDLVINNAGISGGAFLLDATDGEATLRRLLETNLHGIHAIAVAFAPVLKANGGGALVNMLSALSWLSLESTSAYSVSKAAAWALTNSLRNELRAQGTQVLGVHAGYIDTDMVSHIDAPKSSPTDIAARTLEALAKGESEVLADETSRQVKAGFGATPAVYLGAA